MSLTIDAFTAASARNQPQCSIARILADLTPKDREVLTAALADSSVTHSAIAKVLTNNGHKIGSSSVGKHRRRECACAR